MTLPDSPPFSAGSFAVKAQPPLRLLAAVASDAVLLKDGSDVAREGDIGVRFRRSGLGLGGNSCRACRQCRENKADTTYQRAKSGFLCARVVKGASLSLDACPKTSALTCAQEIQWK